ncbi:hypothetical protein ACSBR2_033093 [Camellia fascicularis]
MVRIRRSRGRLVGNAIVLLIFTLNSCWNGKPEKSTDRGEFDARERGWVDGQALIVVVVVGDGGRSDGGVGGEGVEKEVVKEGGGAELVTLDLQDRG